MKMQQVRRRLHDALATIRNLSAQSRENVGINGLQEAIRRYLTTIPTDIQAELDVGGDLGRIPIAYSEELYLIVREAVRNAVDHGRPRRIWISVDVEADHVQAEVHDDGDSFLVNTLAKTQRHVGVDSMRERAKLLGAQLEIISTPSSGTVVSVKVSPGQ